MNLCLILAASFLSFFEARNTIARYAIEPPTDTNSIVRAERPSVFAEETCECCRGAGEVKLQEPDFGQNDGSLSSARIYRKTCPICKGKGRRAVYQNPDTLKAEIAANRQEFENNHRQLGEIALGEAFVPNDLYAKLDRKQMKLIEEGYGKPCTCLWSGLEACRHCHGKGYEPCRAKDCENGFVVMRHTASETNTRSGSSSLRSSSFRSTGNSHRSSGRTTITVNLCPTCQGVAQVICSECSGQRAAPCRRCHGTGEKRRR